MRRRKVLATLAGTGIVTIAGCSGGNGGNGGNADENTNTDDGGNGGNADENTNTDGGGNGDSSEGEQSFQLGEVIWSQNGGNAARSNAVDAEGLTASDPSQYVIELEFNAGTGTVSPVVTENALIGSSQIYDIEDGSVVAELPASSIKPPMYHEGTIVVLTDEGRIRGIDAQSREEQWDFLPQDGVRDFMTANGLVIARVGPVNHVAVDIESGEQVWSREGENIYGYAAGNVFIKDVGSQLAVDTEDGSVAYELNRDIRRVGNGSVYVGALSRLNAEDGSVIWNADIDGAAAVDSEYVYSTGSLDTTYNFAAFDIGSGEQVWSKQDLPSPPASVAVASNRVYASIRNEARTFAFSKDDGEEQARYAVSGSDGLRVGAGTLVAIQGDEATVLRDN